MNRLRNAVAGWFLRFTGLDAAIDALQDEVRELEGQLGDRNVDDELNTLDGRLDDLSEEMERRVDGLTEKLDDAYDRLDRRLRDLE